MHYLLPLMALNESCAYCRSLLHFARSAGVWSHDAGYHMWRAVRHGLDALERRICLLSFIHVMSVEDKLKVVASSVLESLFSSHAVTAPISSFDLLTRVVAFGPPPAGLFPDSGPVPRFRLVDLARFERVLERLAEKWDQGTV